MAVRKAQEAVATAAAVVAEGVAIGDRLDEA